MIAALLMTVALGQDLVGEARRLQAEGRYVAALGMLDQEPDPARAGLQRAMCLWSAGDLGGALRAAQAGLEGGGDPDTRRQLLWRATDLATELGAAALALDLVTRWEEAVEGATDLDERGRDQWRDGWGPGTGMDAARGRVEDLVVRLDAASRGESRARWVSAVMASLALAGMVALGRR